MELQVIEIEVSGAETLQCASVASPISGDCSGQSKPGKTWTESLGLFI